MRAIGVNEWGGRDNLELLDVEAPPVAPDGVLIRVRAASVNPVELAQATASVVARAVLRGVRAATSLHGVPAVGGA